MKSFRAKSLSSGEELEERLGRAAIAGSQPRGGLPRHEASNETHASMTDPDARLFRKGDGQESRLSYLGHALMKNRSGPVVAAEATLATGPRNARRRSV